MTNRELIEHLSQFPPDATVVYNRYSECEELDAESVVLERAEDRKVIKHNQVFMRWRDCYAGGQCEEEFVTVVHFPGN